MATLMNHAEIQGLAHCPAPLCEGHNQQPVPAVREEIGHTYMDSGGDTPFIEKSTVVLRYVNESDAACPRCGRARELTTQARPAYQNLSGYDPHGLVGIKYGPQTRQDDVYTAVAPSETAA